MSGSASVRGEPPGFMVGPVEFMGEPMESRAEPRGYRVGPPGIQGWTAGDTGLDRQECENNYSQVRRENVPRGRPYLAFSYDL